MKWFKRKSQVPQLTNSFWCAVLDARNYVVCYETANYYELPPDLRPGHVFEAVTVLDIWLDTARDEGWLEDPKAQD